jgi:cysteine desulfurase
MYSLADMLGFKLELPQREDGITKKTRPIYLDMQVSEATPFRVNADF